MADYSHLMYDPFSAETLRTLEQYDEFRLTIQDKEKVIAYIILLYDPSSDLKRLYPDSLWERKYQAAVRAGFQTTDGHFASHVEDLIVGNNEEVNQAILMYVRLSGQADLPAYLAYTEVFYKQVLASLKEKDEKRLKGIQENIRNSREEIAAIERKILGGEEVQAVRSALYKLAEKQRLNLRPEYKAQEIEVKSVTLSDPCYTPKTRCNKK